MFFTFFFYHTFTRSHTWQQYTYYSLSCAGTESKKYLGWKKNLTELQMLQFVLVFFHSINAMIRTDCNWSIRSLASLECLHSMLFFFMFSIFYKNTYLKKTVWVSYCEIDKRKKKIRSLFISPVFQVGCWTMKQKSRLFFITVNSFTF